MTKGAKSLDQKLIDTIGRTPTSVIVGGITGVIAEVVFYIGRFAFNTGGIFNQVDSIMRFISPIFYTIAYLGGLGGLIAGLSVGLATGRIPGRLMRSLVGLVVGIISRALAELLIRLVKEGGMELALTYLWLFRSRVLLAGLLIGLMIGSLPLASKQDRS
ncbi:MAG: hypothetical protein AB1489_06495 [Acidobacteriota bacterium]